MKALTRIVLASVLILFGTAASPFSDSFEAHALEPADIKSISIDAALPVPVKDVKVSVNGLLTASTDKLPVPPTGCQFSDPLIQPAGWTERKVPWDKFQIGKPYAQGNPYLTPVGAWTLGLPTMKANYLSVQFVARPNDVVSLTVLGVQRQLAVPGYKVARPANSVFISISPCKGDMRPPNVFTADKWLSKCRFIRAESTLSWSTKPGASCPLVAGQTYYLTIAYVDTSSGKADPKASTCAPPWNAVGACEVNVQAAGK